MITLSQVKNHTRPTEPGATTRRRRIRSLLQAFSSSPKQEAPTEDPVEFTAKPTREPKANSYNEVQTVPDSLARPHSIIEIDSHDAISALPDGTVIVWSDDLSRATWPTEAAVLYTNSDGERQIKHTRERDYCYYELDRVGLPALAIVWTNSTKPSQ